MKYSPTQYQHDSNYTNDASLQGVDLHHKYEAVPSCKGRQTIVGPVARVFIYAREPYKVGDVLIGTMEEFIALFGSRGNLNNYTRLAALKNRDKTVKPVPELIEDEDDTNVNGVIEDSLTSTLETTTQSISYKGVDIFFKPVVNGVVFSNTDEAKTAIDLALRLKLN